MKYLSHFAWVLVAGVALLLSNWSLAFVAMHWHVAEILAWFVSVAFDGTAVICARISLDAARRGDSGMSATITVVIFALLSAFFNSMHAQLAGDPWQARIFFATPPLAALIVLELSVRAQRRDALREAGRIADPLPAMGGAMWANLPLSTYRGIRGVLRTRQGAKLAATAEIEQAQESARAQIRHAQLASAIRLAAIPPELERARTQAAAIRAAFSVLGNSATSPEVSAWLADRGWQVDDSGVRVIRARAAAGQAPDLGRNTGVSRALQDQQGSATGVLQDRQDSAALPPGAPAAELHDAELHDAELHNAELHDTGQHSAGAGDDDTALMTRPVARAGDRIRLGCGHEVTAGTAPMLGDLIHCGECDAGIPYVFGLRLDQFVSRQT